ncbi:unnamed protein product [Microthlaspi erraticum]|uniref:Uncharacterized protein n=1 Tax=Microthlaspi erraticum TaxID=1685480 RepID=A0A6D2L9D5_9BRAS|nr:unnamed protein product [Microthlaspi erraticum]
MFRSAKISSVRLKSRPKSKTVGRSRITTRETKPAVGQATTAHATPRTTKAREPGTSLAAAQPHSRTTADARPSRETTSRVRPRIHRPNLIRPTTRPTTNPSARPFRLGHDPICPADRPDRPSQRRGRPEALLKPKLSYFQARLNPSRL